jgi:hypothetical protein
MVGSRARLLLVWVAAMDVVAFNLHDAEAAQEAMRAEAGAVHQRRPIAEFAGLEEAAAEGDAVLATAVAGLDLTDEPAIAALLRAEVDDLLAGADRAPVPEFIGEWATDDEMLAANEAIVSGWRGEYVEGADGDLFQQEFDAAAGQERQAEMTAAFAGAPPLFQAMLAKVKTDEEFSQIRDGVREALFSNWPLLCQIHALIFDASQPKYPRQRPKTTTSTDPRSVRVECGKCPAMISERKVDEHRARCNGPTTIDVFMYFLACLLGIMRTMPRCVRSFVRFVWRASASALVHACVRAC